MSIQEMAVENAEKRLKEGTYIANYTRYERGRICIY